MATSCSDVKDPKTLPPVLKTNLTPDKPISTNKPITLVFENPIATQSVNQQNIVLQDAKGKPIEPEKYKVDQLVSDKKTILITIKDEVLKGKTDLYKIKLQNLSNEAGVKLTEAKIIDIKLLDSVAPKFLSTNLESGYDYSIYKSIKKLKSTETLVLTFSEALEADTINQTNIVLKNKDGLMLSTSKYKVELDTTEKQKVKLTLTNERLKNTTAEYKLEIKKAVSDEAGNNLLESEKNNIDFKFVDSNAPTLTDTGLSETGGVKQIDSTSTLILTFSENLKESSVTKSNISLQDEDGNSLSSYSYSLEQNSYDKSKVEISFKSDYIKTANYKIKISGVEDLEGNTFVDGEETQKTIEFKILDKSAPTYKQTNLHNTFYGYPKLNSNESLIITFSEALKAETVNKTNIVVTSGSSEISSLYSVKQDATNKAKVIVSFDDKIKDQETYYNLEIKKDLTDEAGNKLSNPKTIYFKIVDKNPPAYKTNNLTNAEISSNEALVLEFSEALEASTVNKDNVTLKFDSGYNVPTDDYRVELDPKDSSKIKISLVDVTKKQNTAKYKISFNNLTDVLGNKLGSSQTIDFTFLKDEIAPTFVADNLGESKQISSNKTIVLTFSEALKTSTVTKQNFDLLTKDGVGITDSNYKVEQDAQDKSKVRLSLNFKDPKLREQTADFKIKIANVEDLVGNIFKDGTATDKTIEFKFLESVQPRFIGSNIFDKKIIQGTEKIVLLFDEPIQDTSASKISIQKGLYDLNGFTATLLADKKTIEITFTAGLDSVSESYKIEIPSTILDVVGNELGNAQTLEFDSIQKVTEKTLFATPNGAGSKDGSSWNDAKTLNQALTDAKSGDIIFVAQGSYYANSRFDLKDGVKIYGGFDTTNINNPRNFEASILEGKLSDGSNATGILNGTGLTNTTVLDGFVIQNALKAYDNGQGAGLYLTNSSPKLTNLTFKNNKLSGDGSEGGAIYNNNSSPSISNCVFTSNSALSGGAIYNASSSSPNISNSVFRYNSAFSAGGAIYNTGSSSPSISNSVFTGNSAGSNNSSGGAIYNSSSSPSISNSTFTANSAKYGGAISNNSSSNSSISNSTFTGNFANYRGGAIENFSSSSPSISNSILWDNKDKNTVAGELINNIYNNDSSSNPAIKYSILNAGSIAGSNITIDTKVNGDNNQTPTSFVLESDGRVVDADSKALIKDKGDNALYLKVYNKINGTSETTIPATDKDLAGNRRVEGGYYYYNKIDIGAYEVQY